MRPFLQFLVFSNFLGSNVISDWTSSLANEIPCCQGTLIFWEVCNMLFEQTYQKR